MKKRIVIVLLCMILVFSTLLSGCKTLGKLIGEKLKGSDEDEEEYEDWEDDDWEDDYYEDDDEWDDYYEDDEYDDEDWDEYDDEDEDWDDYEDDEWDNDFYGDEDWEEEKTLEDFFYEPENLAFLENKKNNILSLSYDTYADVVYEFSENDIYIDYYFLEKYEEMEDDIIENLEAADWTEDEAKEKQDFLNFSGIEPENIYFGFYIEGGDYLYSNY